MTRLPSPGNRMPNSKQNILAPIRLTGFHEQYKHLFDDEKDFTFIKLLEAINMKALDFPSHSKFPRMDLSALYCLGVTIQEYARYLGTDLLTEKRATENLTPLNTLYDQEEIKSRQWLSIINSQQQRHPKKQIIEKANPSRYEQMLRLPEWRNNLKRKRSEEANAEATKIRREKNDIRVQKIKLEKALRQEEERQLVGKRRAKTEYILPPTPPVDIFDMSRKKAKHARPLKKKRKNVNSF